MKPKLSPTENQFLALVRASLWQKPVEETDFTKDDIDWQRIGQLALQQTVGILVFEGALSLSLNLRPPKEWIQKAFAFIEANRRTHILIDGCLSEAITRLHDGGIDPVLLKGQAYARAYPRPDMRQCGDIDLYVGEQGYLQAYSVIKELGWKREDQFLPKAKHYGCWLRGIRIELHRIAAQLPSRSADRIFQEWSRKQISESNRCITIGDKEIPVPTPTFDVVFVFLHLYHHFLSGGIGLRHICDWTMLMHAHAKEINHCELEQKLKEFHLLSAWKMFAPIAVEHLGLPSEECPFYSSKNRKEAERLLAFIFAEGNFGRAKQPESIRPNGYITGKIYSFKRHSARMYSKLWIDPHTISMSYVSYVIRGVSRVIKDIMKRE